MRNYIMTKRENNDLFDEMMNSFFKPMFYDEKVATMATDIKETKLGYELDIDMPGFDKSQISIDYNKGYLTIEGKSLQNTSSEENSEEKRYIRQERTFACRRSYYVGEVNEEEIKAKFENGVLMVSVPKKQKEIPAVRHIAID